MKKKDLKKFEKLSEEKSGYLVNGFSVVVEGSSLAGGKAPVNIFCARNNCSGGNCISGCGSSSSS